MTRTIDDSALLLSVIARPDRRDYTARPYPEMDWFDHSFDPTGLRIGVQLDAGSGIDPDPEVLAAVSTATEQFARAGAAVEVLAPFMTREQLKGVDDFWRTKFFALFSGLGPQEKALVLPYIAEWCRQGQESSGTETVANFHRMAEIQQATARATARFDLMLSPVAPIAAFPAELPMPLDDPALTMGHISFTLPYNMSGQQIGRAHV